MVSARDPAARTDGGPGGSPAGGQPAPSTVAELDPDAEVQNARILQAALGPDFEIAPDGAVGSLRPGSASAEGLPERSEVTTSITASVATDNALPQLCAPRKEKGSTLDGCLSRARPDGQVVQANFSRWAPQAEYLQETAGEGVRVLFRQTNGVVVYVDMTVSEDADLSTTERSAAARAWLESMLERIGAAVTDPDVEPVAFLQSDLDPDPVEKANG